jgi:tRNA nucleotidyltransferase (CCA-adding enzyme)
MKLLNEVIKNIKPTEEEEKEVKAKIDDFLKRVNKGLKDAKAELGGSGAKGTWLSQAHDADIFVAFNYQKFKDRSEQLSDILEKRLKKNFKKIIRLHGSRDYFQIKEEGFTFEVVPILKISKAEDARNITDVSPLHAAWVRKHKEFADDIRLTKQFCKASKAYGAESYIRGFSGYICEILTIYYKGFLNLVKAASKWQEKTVIDVEKYYRNKNEVLSALNKSKLEGPLVIIDPVQKDRNAAAALSEQNYRRFIVNCREFLENPSGIHFKVIDFTLDEIKKPLRKNKKKIVLKIKPLKGKEDIVGCKLLKVFEFIQRNLEKNEFKEVYYGNWQWNKEKDEALMWFEVDKKPLPEYVIKEGPPIKLKEYVANFKKQYKGKTFVKKGKIYAKVKRDYRDASKLVKDLIKDKYVKEKVKSISFS